MHFAFDEDQLEFRAQLRAFAEKECTPGRRPTRRGRRRSDGRGRAGRRWPRWAWWGSPCPRNSAGWGSDLIDVVLLLEEAGRAGLPEPLLETVALGVPAAGRRRRGPRATCCGPRWLSAGRRRRGDDRRRARRPCRPCPARWGPTCCCSSATASSTPCPPPRSALTPRPALDGSRRLAAGRVGAVPGDAGGVGVRSRGGPRRAGRPGRDGHGGGVGGRGRPAGRHGRAPTPRSGCSSASPSGPSRP